MSSVLIRVFGARAFLRPWLVAGLACVALSSACGGRWRTITTTPDDDSSVSGGAVGASGAPSGHAGSTSAQAGAAMSQAGTSATCAGTACPAIACAEGSVPVVLAGACCPVCQAQCMQACPACLPGFQAQAQPGVCCPDCVPSASCDAGKATYNDVRSTAAYKFSYGCVSDADCSTLAPSNQCESGCSYVAVPNGLVESFTDFLKSESLSDCSTCMQGVVPPCAPPPAAHCYSGQCALSQP